MMTFPLLVDLVRKFVATYSRTVAWVIAYVGFIAEQERLIVGARDAPMLGT